MLWSEFVDKLGRVTRTQETQAEYARMPKDERDSAKDVGGFVGGTLKGGRRKIDAVRSAGLLRLIWILLLREKTHGLQLPLFSAARPSFIVRTVIRRRRRGCG